MRPPGEGRAEPLGPPHQLMFEEPWDSGGRGTPLRLTSV